MRKAFITAVCISVTLLAPALWDYGIARAQKVEGTVQSRGHPPLENPDDPARVLLDPADIGSMPVPADIEALERGCLDEINRVRRAHRLPPLEFSRELLLVARDHSRRMCEEGFFSHTDPQGLSTRERVNVAGIKWKAVAENIASSRGYTNPVAVSMSGWMNSDGHRSNILNGNFNLTAVGVWIGATGAVYFTEIFLKR